MLFLPESLHRCIIGTGRIRTYVERIQQIYNLSPLTTQPLSHSNIILLFFCYRYRWKKVLACVHPFSCGIPPVSLKKAFCLLFVCIPSKRWLFFWKVRKTLYLFKNWCIFLLFTLKKKKKGTEKGWIQGQYQQQIMNVVIFCCCKCNITTFIYFLKDVLYCEYPFIIFSMISLREIIVFRRKTMVGSKGSNNCWISDKNVVFVRREIEPWLCFAQ